MSAASNAHNQAPGDVWRSHRAQLWQDRYRVGVVLCGGLLITLVLAMSASKRYTAEASLLLRLGREYMYTPEVGDANGRTPLAYDREQTIQSETRILLSRDVLEAAVARLGAARIYPALAGGAESQDNQSNQAVLLLEKSLDAELLKGTNLMQIQLKHADPQIAASTLSALIEAYLKKRQTVFASADGKLIEEDHKASEARLHAVEAKIAEFKHLHGLVAFSEEQSLLLAQRSALALKRSDVVLSQAQSGGRVAALRGRLGVVPAQVTLSSETQRSDAAESALKLLMDLKLKERDVSAKFADSEPLVQDVRRDIELTSDHIKTLRNDPPRSVKVGRSVVRDAAETDLEHALADQGQAVAGAQTLTASLNSVNKRLRELTDIEGQWLQLQRQQKLAESDFETAARRLRDDRITSQLDRQRQSNVSVVQAPKVPLEGKSARGAIFGVGGALSLAAALLTTFMSAWSRQRSGSA